MRAPVIAKTPNTPKRIKLGNGSDTQQLVKSAGIATDAATAKAMSARVSGKAIASIHPFLNSSSLLVWGLENNQSGLEPQLQFWAVHLA
ncbi:MAG: hypothetical protein V7K47_16710 [Nostoc sp.]